MIEVNLNSPFIEVEFKERIEIVGVHLLVLMPLEIQLWTLKKLGPEVVEVVIMFILSEFDLNHCIYMDL